MDVFLSDKWQNKLFDLRSGDYNFTSSSVPVTDRFSIVFRTGNVGLTTESVADNLLAYTDKNGHIVVALYLWNQEGNEADVSIFDIAGRKVADQPVIVGERTTIEGAFPGGVYIVHAGKFVTKVVVKR
jgi:DNA-binding beta-propeller fold protein YncE